METAIVSDTHGYLPEINPEFPTDLFIHCGDLCPVTNHNVEFQANFVNDKFIPWINSVPAKNKVFIAGNHDFVFDYYPDLIDWNSLDDSVKYLKDSFVTVDGLKVYGTPWVPIYGRWAFMRSEEELRILYGNIPLDTNILVTHGPPFGILDANPSGHNCGSKTLLDKVFQLKQLNLHCFGHIHQSRGMHQSERNLWVDFVNAASVDEDYELRKHYITSLMLS